MINLFALRAQYHFIKENEEHEQKMKRHLCFLLTVVMVASLLFSVTAFASDNNTPADQVEDTGSFPVTVKLVDENGKEVTSYRAIVTGNVGYINTSDVKLPEGYEVAQAGDIAIVDGVVTVSVREVPQYIPVTVKIVDENGNEVTSYRVIAASTDTYVNTNDLTIPEGYEVAQAGDIAIVDGVVTVSVREVPQYVPVTVKVVDENGNEVTSYRVIVANTDTYVNTSDLRIPEGYEVAQAGDLAIVDGVVTVSVREVPQYVPVTVKVVDENGKEVANYRVIVANTDTYVNTSDLRIPEGYEVAQAGDMPIVDGVVTVSVRAKVVERSIRVNYVTEDGKNVLTSSIVVPETATSINTSALKDAIYGYEIAVVGDINIEKNETITVTVREKTFDRTVTVNYVTEDGKNILTSSIVVPEDVTSINTSVLNHALYGYEIAVVGDVAIENNTITVTVREKTYDRTVTVNYVTEDGKNVLTSSIVVPENDTYVNTSALKDALYGYEIAVVGDIAIEDNTITVLVAEKTYDRTVTVNYVTEDGKNVLTGTIVVSEDVTSINTSVLNHAIYGYEIAVVGDVAIENNTITVTVREKSYDRTVTVNYVTEDGKNVLTSSIVVPETDTYVNTGALKDALYGYEIAIFGDMPIVDNTINVTVREKTYDRTVTVNYVTEDGKNVLTSSIVVPENDTYVNTNSLKDALYGYEIAVVGDVAIENNTITVTVREKSYDRTVTVNYVTEDGKNVLTSSIVVPENDTYVNTNSLKDALYGYEIAVVGDIAIEGNAINVLVRESAVVDPTEPETTEPETTEPETTEPETTAPETTESETTAPSETQKPADNVPHTGDESHMGMWIALATISLFGAAAAFVFDKKRNTAK